MRGRNFLFGFALLYLAWLCLWPGDTSFNVDEPVFVQKALRHNAAGTWAKYALTGTKYTPYGPAAIWFYQITQWFTVDPVKMGLVRGVVSTLLTVLGLSWLGNVAALPLWAGVIALLSPYFYIYSRQLWDNTHLVPYAALLLGAYARFLVKPAARWFFVSVLAATLMFLIHLMALALIIPVACHALWFHHRWLKSNIKSVLIAGVGAGLLSGYYLRHLYAALLKAPSMTGNGQLLEPWYFPLLGWRYFSVSGLEYFFGVPWVSYACGEGLLCHGLGLFTGFALPLFLLGIALVARSTVVHFRKKKQSGQQILDALVFGILLFSILFNGKLQTYGHPHYQNGVWVVWFYLLWRAAAALMQRWPRAGRAVVCIYGFAMVVALALTTRGIHQHAGSRTRTFGTTLSEQLRIAQKLKGWSPEALVKVQVQGPPMDYLPFRVLCEVNGWVGEAGGPQTTPVVSYREGQSSPDAWLEIH